MALILDDVESLVAEPGDVLEHALRRVRRVATKYTWLAVRPSW